MRHFILLILIGILFPATTYTQNKEAIDWNTDLDYLANELSEKHYNFFTIKSKEYFLSGINAIKRNSNNLTDFQIALKTQQLISRMGDSHTMLYFTPLIDKSQTLPISLFWTSDGLHIIHTTAENKEILGNQLLSINNIPTSTVIDSLSSLFTIDNEATVKSIMPMLIPSVQILSYFGFADGNQVEIGLKTNDGQLGKYLLKTSVMDAKNRVSFKPDSIAFCIKNEKAFFTDAYYPDEKIYYMLYNKCWSKEIEYEFGNKEKAEMMPSFATFEENAFNVLENQDVDKIIFDMRFNGGGNSSQGTAFIEKLATFLDKHPNKKMYVVLGRNTFSSAILNALDFKRLTKAVFIGEETAGKPNHFGEVKNFQLPNSELSIGYSTKFFKNSDENGNTLKPNVTIEMSFSDFTKGVDPVYEWVKRQ